MTIVDFYTQYNTFMLFCKDKFITPPLRSPRSALRPR